MTSFVTFRIGDECSLVTYIRINISAVFYMVIIPCRNSSLPWKRKDSINQKLPEHGNLKKWRDCTILKLISVRKLTEFEPTSKRMAQNYKDRISKVEIQWNQFKKNYDSIQTNTELSRTHEYFTSGFFEQVKERTIFALD